MKRKRKEFDRVAAEAFGRTGIEPCAVCGSGFVVAHHIVEQQHLRSVSRTKGLDYERLRWDTRNRLWLCEPCHRNHHAASPRVSMQVLFDHAPEVFDFAHELGLDWRLDRTYPVEQEAAA